MAGYEPQDFSEPAAAAHAARQRALKDVTAAKLANRTPESTKNRAEAPPPGSAQRWEADRKTARDARYAARKLRKR